MTDKIDLLVSSRAFSAPSTAVIKDCSECVVRTRKYKEKCEVKEGRQVYIILERKVIIDSSII